MISVITPSFRQLDWLKLCAASIADQTGVEVEHIVQDAGSGAELEQWAATQPRLKLWSEPDKGMYDAINRGLAKACGDICAYLNCDEQYLPGTLRTVVEFFDSHPDVDVLFGDVVLVDANGQPLSYRRSILPNSRHLHLAHLNTSSCATFFRRSVVDRGLLFDTSWKAAGDAVWIDSLLQAGLKMAVLPRALSVFTFTGENLGASDVSRSESLRWREEAAGGNGAIAKAMVVCLHRLRKLLAGAYWPRRVAVDIFTLALPDRRQCFERRVGFGWPA
jgi:glycosyltransferase involved in cell wall biosynthesis